MLSILDYRDTALARPAHQVSREGKNQSQSKSEKVDGVRPRASVRGTDAATSSQTASHLDSKQNPVEPAPAPVNRQEGQGQRFHFPPPRHAFTSVPHPLARRDLQPPVRNSIGVSVPSNNINSRTAPPVPNSRPIAPETFSFQHGATSRIGSINARPVAPGDQRAVQPRFPRRAVRRQSMERGLCAAALGRRKSAGRPANHARRGCFFLACRLGTAQL